jgi:pilus assembly protein Flp/PilA
METLKVAVADFWSEEEGATAVEYAVMLALIIVVCIGSVNVLANNTGESFNRSADAIAAAFAN